MNENTIEKLTRKHQDILFVASEANGMYYGTHRDDPDRIAIIGDAGITILKAEQVHAIAQEIEEIYAMYSGKSGFPHGEEIDHAYRDRHRDWFIAQQKELCS